MTLIRLAYSPDSDDAFMFWALKSGQLHHPLWSFEHLRADTQALNQRSEAPLSEAPHVCAISIHQYAYIHDRYLLLPHGGSVGVGYGPIVVSRDFISPTDLKNKRVAIPGFRTTAYLALRILIGEFEAVPIPIQPFDRVFAALEMGEVDAAILIHEGRLLYEQRGLHAVLELGEAWQTRTQLPLPLGGNVIRRDLGSAAITSISQLLQESIAWSLTHRNQVIQALLAEETRPNLHLERATLDRYLSMYANQDTLDYGAQGRKAIAELLRLGHECGVIPHAAHVEFAP